MYDGAVALEEKHLQHPVRCEDASVQVSSG